MKKYILILSLAALSFGCDDFLDRQPLDTPSSATFFSNEAEIKIGLTGVYNAAFWNNRGFVPDLKRIEGATDLIISRKTDAESLMAMGDTGPFIIGNAISELGWQQGYRLVARANDFLEGMKRGETKTAKAAYARMRGEALTLRAWAYLHLITWYGDVVFYTQPLQPETYETQSQTPRADIVKALYKDLDEAYASLDLNPSERGRASKHFALGIKARLAMLIKDYATAAEATNTIIKSGNHSLNPNYQALFTLAGQTANAGR
jgi:starch-binding outer membrane protein, SusD/RagB family